MRELARGASAGSRIGGGRRATEARERGGRVSERRSALVSRRSRTAEVSPKCRVPPPGVQVLGEDTQFLASVLDAFGSLVLEPDALAEVCASVMDAVAGANVDAPRCGKR